MTAAEPPLLVDAVSVHVQFYIRYGITDRVLAVHVADESGHCAGCRWLDAPQPVWPCSHAFYARAAKELMDRYPP